MERSKTNMSSKKKAKKPLIQASTKYKLLVAGIITAVVLAVGGYLVYQTALPARILTGATIAGESVKVNEINYHFNQSYSMYYQYGIITSRDDLDTAFDETTGQTYGDYLYEMAAQTQQSVVLLNQEAKKAGFVAESVDRQVDEYIQTIRDYASTNNTTADQVLKGQYGAGITVRDVKNFMTRELTAQEYTEYLKQTEYTMTEEEMQAAYDAAPEDYDTVTFNAYLVAGQYDAAATADEIALAVTAASEKAQTILDATTDAKSFHDASEAAAGTDGASGFADDADPTIFEDINKSYITSYLTEDIAAYLFDADRKAGDKEIITTDTGAYAVYFQSRQLDEAESASYRILTLDDTDVAAAKAKLEEYKTSVTDEASFISLAKKHSEDSATAYKGGLVSDVTAASFDAAAATEQETALKAWLFSGERKAGDMVILETTESATLYYYQKSLPSWKAGLSTSNAATEYTAWYNALAAEEGNGYTLNKKALEFATY